jgi:hypothetical protein
MNVEELIKALQKQDPKARVIVAGDHDANNFFTVLSVELITDDDDGYEELEDWEKERTWKKGDVELDIWG